MSDLKSGTPLRSPQHSSGRSARGDTARGNAARPRRIRTYVAAARGVLLWDGVWPALAPAVGTVAAFIALSLFDVLPGLPGSVHAAILGLFALGFVGSLFWAFRRIAMPSVEMAERRLEMDSGLEHRPLTAMADTLVESGDPANDAVSRAIWERHLERARENLKKIHLKGPSIPLAKREPLAPRALIAMVLVIAVAGSWGDMTPRLARAMVPDFTDGAARVPLTLDLWIVPPEYTGEPPRFFHAGIVGGEGAQPEESGVVKASERVSETSLRPEQPVAVPASSRMRLQIQGGRGEPSATLGGTQVALEGDPNGVRVADIDVGEGGTLVISQRGREIGRWELEIIPDRAPIIAFIDPPQRTDRSALRFEYEARDDYGVSSVRVRVTRQDGEEAGGPVVLELPLSAIDAQVSSAASFHDLTDHLWAGVPGTMVPEAEDDVGQIGTGDPFETIIPERIFNHPVARALVALRKELTIDPDERAEVIEGLDKLSRRPQHFYDDAVVFLAMRVALKRLLNDDRLEAARSAQSIMWDTALRLEDGEVSLAARDLREIQRELQEALANDASNEEIEQLMAELQQAIDRYLEAMQREMAERGDLTPEQLEQLQEQMGDMQSMNRESLQDMLDRAREMSRTGAKDAAREMLQQLQQMLENLQAMPLDQLLEQQQQNQEAMRLLNDLDRLAQQQRELMDRTFRESQQNRNRDRQRGQNPDQRGRRLPNLPGRQQPGPGTPGQQGEMGDGQEFGQNQGQNGQGRSPTQAEQDALRDQLAEIMRRLGEMGGQVPGPLDRADRSMNDASRALGENAPGQAVGPQGDALDQLQQGAQSLAEQMMQQFGPQMGQGPGQGQGTQDPQNPGFDPLGRDRNRAGMSPDSDNVEIPEDWEIQRSRDILNELRRRSGERFRPPVELDYLDRLLDRF